MQGLSVPTGKRQLVDFALDLVQKCTVSVGMRSSYYNVLNRICETGRSDGTKALVNLMFVHLARTAAHLYSPTQLRFHLSYLRKYPKEFNERAKVVAEVLTDQWDRTDTDLMFGQGVFESLKYGACFLKQWPQVEGVEETPTYYQKLVMPWQFGVYNEAETNLDLQYAMCETNQLTLPEVWRRICHLPGAQDLFKRVEAQSSTGQSMSDPQSFFHQVLSESKLSTSATSASATAPGGILQIGQDPNYSIMGPQVAAPTVRAHEIWVQDGKDYTTIQLIEPDIIIAPQYSKANLLIKDSGKHPYDLIQPNQMTNWIWGRSELVDLAEPQSLLSTWCDDARRLMGVQIDKFLGFIGESGMTDELYGQARFSGFVNMQQGSTIQDLTPKVPPELLPMIKWMIETINQLGSFPPIMQGQGEGGVRAGVHADTLLKTASPTLRDRSLLTERQCAKSADKTLCIMEAKDGGFYWTKADTVRDTDETKFLLSSLPSDWRVTIDSHSSSPIFADENSQMIWAGLKSGIVDDEYVLDTQPFPNKEMAKQSARERKKEKAAFMKQLETQHPEIFEKVALKEIGGGKKR